MNEHEYNNIKQNAKVIAKKSGDKLTGVGYVADYLEQLGTSARLLLAHIGVDFLLTHALELIHFFVHTNTVALMFKNIQKCQKILNTNR